MGDLNEHDDEDHGLVFPGLTPEEIIRSSELWNRGDLLVTVCLGAFSEGRAGNEKLANEGLGQLRQLIADDPDPADLIHKLVLSIALTVMNAARDAHLEPLEYWQQQRLDAASKSVRNAERMAKLRWDDIPDDILREEERRLRERRERESDGGDPETRP